MCHRIPGQHTRSHRDLYVGLVLKQRGPLAGGRCLDDRLQASFRWFSNGESGHGRLQIGQSDNRQQNVWLICGQTSSIYILLLWRNSLPESGCFMCTTGWKDEQEREYASLLAAVLAICFLKDSGRPLFKNSLRALNCSSSWEFSEPSRLLSSKIDTVWTDFSWIIRKKTCHLWR